jgi:cation transport ATPase
MGRNARLALIVIALVGLGGGLSAWLWATPSLAFRLWTAGTVPVLAVLGISMVRDLLAGRMGVDAVAFVSMSAALVLGEGLAAAVVAVMYAGGNVLEEFAVARAERDLKSLVDRTPRIAHRHSGGDVEDVPVDQVAVGDILLVRGGEVVPVDGVIETSDAVIDESALTGEPVPVHRRQGEVARSGTINAGEMFELATTATAGQSTYAGIVRMRPRMWVSPWEHAAPAPLRRPPTSFSWLIGSTAYQVPSLSRPEPARLPGRASSPVSACRPLPWAQPLLAG